MPEEKWSMAASTLDAKSILTQLETPFALNQLRWRVTNTAKDKKRGQVVPYADSRAYADRLNTLLTPQGWTREYQIETMRNITRLKGDKEIITGKVLVTCTVTIRGLWSHPGTGEEWADDPNAMTSADAQAFKRACACFGLGRYLYEFHGSWVDLDQNQQPKHLPTPPAWAIPENWRLGMRPPGRNGDFGVGSGNGARSNGDPAAKSNGSHSDELTTRIQAFEKTLGSRLYRSLLLEYGKLEHPNLMSDPLAKQRVFQVLESAVRGIGRLNAVKEQIDPKMLDELLAKLQAPPLTEIADMKTLRNVVFGLEQMTESTGLHTA